MGQIDYITKNRKGKHLNYEERIKLEALYKTGLCLRNIGKELGGRSEGTIRREIKRGLVELLNSDLTTRYEYSADIGQSKYDINATAKGPGLKIAKDHKLIEYLEKAIGKEKMSPYAAIESIKNNHLKFDESICFKTLYNYLDNDLFLHISNKDLPVKKNNTKRRYQRVRSAANNVKGTSISERPEAVDRRQEYGHWACCLQSSLVLPVGKSGR